MSGFLDDWNFRGLTYQVTDDGLMGQLASGGKVVYNGFDPSAASLHVGHLVPLLALRRLQIAGNRPIVLAGGATGMIGDPSFKSDERVLLNDEQIQINLKGIFPQLQSLLDFSKGSTQAKLVNNYDWLSKLGTIEFLRDVGKHFTVNQLVARDAVRERFENREQGISFTEFSYSLLQARDFQHLFETEGCDVQMGASDQWGNIVAGVELIRRSLGKIAHGLTLPLLLRADGKKFGKTEEGTVWLDANLTSPFAMYQYFIRSDDADVPVMLRQLTMLPAEEIIALEKELTDKPAERAAQKVLARSVVELVHGEKEAQRAEKAAELLYSEEVAKADEATLGVLVSDAPSTDVSRAQIDAGIAVDSLLVDVGLVSSKSAARTALKQGGVYVNNVRIEEGSTVAGKDLLHGRFVLLRKGKRDYHVVRVS